MDDDHIVRFYADWSDLFYAAGFMSPDSDTVRSFRSWLHSRSRIDARPRESYEQAMLDEFHRQETADAKPTWYNKEATP